MEVVWRTLCIGVLFTKECEWITNVNQVPSLADCCFWEFDNQVSKVLPGIGNFLPSHALPAVIMEGFMDGWYASCC